MPNFLSGRCEEMGEDKFQKDFGDQGNEGLGLNAEASLVRVTRVAYFPYCHLTKLLMGEIPWEKNYRTGLPLGFSIVIKGHL